MKVPNPLGPEMAKLPKVAVPALMWRIYGLGVTEVTVGLIGARSPVGGIRLFTARGEKVTFPGLDKSVPEMVNDVPPKDALPLTKASHAWEASAKASALIAINEPAKIFFIAAFPKILLRFGLLVR